MNSHHAPRHLLASLLALALLDIASADDRAAWHDAADDWPTGIEAARAYHCWPTRTRTTQDSLTLWTDKAHRVVAFGASFEGRRIPFYATMLLHTEADSNGAVFRAGPGYRVAVTNKSAALVVGAVALNCDRSSDD